MNVWITCLFLLFLGVILFAQESVSCFLVWNALPIIAGFIVLCIGMRIRGPFAAACITAGAVAPLLPVFFHLAWYFDWGGTATGSSTAGLAFIFIPFWAGLLSLGAGAVAWILALAARG